VGCLGACSPVRSLFVGLTSGSRRSVRGIAHYSNGAVDRLGASVRVAGKTKSGAMAVQTVLSRYGSPDIEHMGSAHNEAELESLKAADRQRMVADQLELALGLNTRGRRGRCPSRPRGWDTCWTPSGTPTGPWGWWTQLTGMRCSRSWCLAEVIEPTSKPDSLWVLQEAWLARRMRRSGGGWRQRTHARTQRRSRCSPSTVLTG
jgi:hypothetical protein